MVSVERISRAMQDPRFAERILTSLERERGVTAEYLAGRFAAKEAIKKCLPALSSWHQAEILGSPGQPPEVSVKGAALPTGHKLHISISHEREFSVALAILEKVSS